MYGPPPARKPLPEQTVYKNVSGLLQVSCCYSQAMMRSAHPIPIKWYELEARFFSARFIGCRTTVVSSSQSLAN